MLAEQLLNGLQLGCTLFLITAGLTLTFGVMGLLNLAHGTLYMAGAFVAAKAVLAGWSLPAALAAAVAACAALGLLLESAVFRRLYARDHLMQVLATYALILIGNDLARWVFGRQPYQIDLPPWLADSVHLGGELYYPLYRLLLIGAGVLLAAALFTAIARTRLGMLVRAGSTHREIVTALGVDVPRLFLLVFALGAVLAGVAGALVSPLQAVEVGMGDNITILALVVVVIGGVGSVRGALAASMLVGVVDTLGRALLPGLLKQVTDASTASAWGGSLSAMAVYLLMVAVLLVKPAGLLGNRV